MKYYKWIADGLPIYGMGAYDLSGKWQYVEGPLSACENGFHVCRADQVHYWIGTELWEVEISDETINCGNKICCRGIRFVRRLAWDKDKMIRYAWCCAFATADTRAAVYAHAAAAAFTFTAAVYAHAAAIWARNADQRAWIEAGLGEELED